MSETRYERVTQANVDNDNTEPSLDINSNDSLTRDDDTTIEMPNQRLLHGFAQTAISTLGLILIYFTLSIGLTFYQRNFLKQFHYPLLVVCCHLVFKLFLSFVIRIIYRLVTGITRIQIDWRTSMKAMSPSGLASGIDIGFSNWGLELVTVSLYTMTKSTTIVFILIFAILLKLEKKSWSLMMIVVMISMGLFMFTYKSTNFNALGFSFLIFASLCSGIRWSFAQLVMQKSKLGLHNPIDMIYYMQPWMLLSIVPFTIGFEGQRIYEASMTLSTVPIADVRYLAIQLVFGAFIAFAMELSEFLVLSKTSSLTLSVSGIFKEICQLVLAIELDGDQLSPLNVLGLIMCLGGICCHVIHKYYVMTSSAYSETTKLDTDTAVSFDKAANGVQQVNLKKYRKDQSVPLLQADILDSTDSDASENDNQNGSDVIFDVLKRRDMRR
ncbi:solute carrier family 35 member C2 [Bradysia coprophila]|uniref:solute carrier family 35 member C2 n=1 Tax=Bradysia coprophila TaxID=38358 RepID=UPI00187DC90D|nr:solute carrier family 35 member C2 [Bradysia coprophila]XP_037037483.1 solute carrier family 35 member C2 [Bradysia coprophila]